MHRERGEYSPPDQTCGFCAGAMGVLIMRGFSYAASITFRTNAPAEEWAERWTGGFEGMMQLIEEGASRTAALLKSGANRDILQGYIACNESPVFEHAGMTSYTRLEAVHRLLDKALESAAFNALACFSPNDEPSVFPLPIEWSADLQDYFRSQPPREQLTAWAVIGGDFDRLLGISPSTNDRLSQLLNEGRDDWQSVRKHDLNAFMAGQWRDWVSGLDREFAFLRSAQVEDGSRETTRECNHETKLPLDARAVALLVINPDWTDTKIAAEVGCARTSLYRCEAYMRFRNGLKESARNSLPRGIRRSSEDGGGIEAWQ